MKITKHTRLVAILLAAALCWGCTPELQEAVPTDIVSASGQLVLVDPFSQEESSAATYSPESPSINSDVSLPEKAEEETSSTAEIKAEEQPEPESNPEPEPELEPVVVSAPETQAASGSATLQAESVARREGDNLDLNFEDDAGSKQTVSSAVATAAKPQEVRSVWISYLEMENLLKGKTEKQFRTNMREVLGNIEAFGLNTVIVHVRPFGDALYNSEVFPWSYIATGTEGKDPGFDPLEITIEEARARGLRVEAWVNPYRIRASGNKNALCAENPAKRWIDTNSTGVISYNGTISYNPASQDARALIVSGIRELVRGYDIDAIHIDDYFYPSTDTAFDAASYSAYKSGGGKLALADWRRQNVETLVRDIYKAVKEENSRVLFGISPQSSVYNNYHAQYLDVEKLASNAGYCDYICPQIYFGFENDVQPFQETLESWNNMVKTSAVELYIGVAAYKIGNQDSWAGTGKLEWTKNSDLLKRMVQASRKQTSYGGFVVYRYDSLFVPASEVRSLVQSEAKNLQLLLK